jgi:hypothetical protein
MYDKENIIYIMELLMEHLIGALLGPEWQARIYFSGLL